MILCYTNHNIKEGLEEERKTQREESVYMYIVLYLPWLVHLKLK